MKWLLPHWSRLFDILFLWQLAKGSQNDTFNISLTNNNFHRFFCIMNITPKENYSTYMVPLKLLEHL